jgi:hypothetical protein
MAFPRLCAFAEVVWHKGDGFAARLGQHLARLDALGVNYRPPSGPRPWDARPDAPGAAPRARRPGRRTGRDHRGPAYDLTSASGSATGSRSISRRA